MHSVPVLSAGSAPRREVGLSASFVGFLRLDLLQGLSRLCRAAKTGHGPLRPACWVDDARFRVKLSFRISVQVRLFGSKVLLLHCPDQLEQLDGQQGILRRFPLVKQLQWQAGSLQLPCIQCYYL